MNTVKNIIKVIFGLPKSLYFNLKYFGSGGLRLPCVLSNSVKLKSCRGGVKINAPFKTGMIKIGFPGVESIDDSGLHTIWINNGEVEFCGKASIRNGSVIRNNGHLVFGTDFQASSSVTVICYDKITFGNQCLIGWNCQFQDGDGHKIINENDGSWLNQHREITVGDHVWFGAFSRVYKGVSIKADTVVAANTILTKTFDVGNIVVGGSPNRIIKEKVAWKI